jgi:hypothetical protein
VIRSVEIKDLRGIRNGKLADLTPLVVLVGPNGSGKSTILDALLIGSSPVPGDAVGRAVRRRQGVSSGARWLIAGAGREGSARVTVTTDRGAARMCLLALEPASTEAPVLRCLIEDAGGQATVAVRFLRQKGRTYECERMYRPLEDVVEVRLVQAHAPDHLQPPLHQLYTSAVEQGRRTQAREVLSAVVPGLDDVEILTDDGAPIVHLVFPSGSVPAALAGDGIQGLLRLALELASRPRGVVLVEEPEVHQHPATIRQSARAILAAVRRDVQVVLTTHSLELIDALVSESSDRDLDYLSLYSVQLDKGYLKSFRMAGCDVAFARTQIQDDLR